MEPNPNLNNLTTKQTKAAAAPPPPPPPPPPASGGGGLSSAAAVRRRRKAGAAENVEFHDSKYAHIRTLLRDLRPAFVEILKTPDYRNSRHAFEVCRGMRQMMELCKQLRTETCMLGKNKRSDGTPAAGDSADIQSNKRQRDDAPQESQKRHKEDTPQESYLVGGSPIGWNFILFMKTEKKSTVTA